MLTRSGVICLAVYRPDPTLLEAQIGSLQSQTVGNWACIVGVDGGDPETVGLLRRVIRNDRRFIVHAFGNRVGFYRNFERILQLVTGDAAWVALSDQDDFWYPEKLEILLGHLEDVSLVSGQARVVQADHDPSSPVSTRVTSRAVSNAGELLLDNAVSGALTVFRTELLRFALPFPPQTDVAYHDHWIGLCAFLQKGIYFTPTVVQDYVQHGANVIGEERTGRMGGRFAALAARGAGAGAWAEYLVTHRWRWRVSMSRVALIRMNDIRAHDAQVLRAFAINRFSSKLLRTCLSALMRGRVSKLRVASIIFASMLAPIIAEEADDEC